MSEKTTTLTRRDAIVSFSHLRERSYRYYQGRTIEKHASSSLDAEGRVTLRATRQERKHYYQRYRPQRDSARDERPGRVQRQTPRQPHRHGHCQPEDRRDQRMAAQVDHEHQGRRHGSSLGKRKRPHERSYHRQLGRRTTLHDTITQTILAQQLNRLGRGPRQHGHRRKPRQNLRQKVTGPKNQTPKFSSFIQLTAQHLSSQSQNHHLRSRKSPKNETGVCGMERLLTLLPKPTCE